MSNHKKPAPWASTTDATDKNCEPAQSLGDYPVNLARPLGGDWRWTGFALMVLFGLCVTALMFLSCERLSPPPVSAQVLGTFYTWSDSLAATTTAIDCTFATRWENALIWAVGADLYVRVGAPDVSSWSKRKWIRVLDGMGVAFGPATKLTRFEYKTVSGTGALFFSGTKRRAQF